MKPVLKVKAVRVRRAHFSRDYKNRMTCQLRWTRSHTGLMKQVGECIKAGGRVDLDYIEDQHGQIFATGTLDWN